MNPADVIAKAKAEGRTTLNEAESKMILAEYGVPVVREAVGSSPDEAAIRADSIGYPVVLKGLGSKLAHKTEMGMVRLGLDGPDEVRRVAAELQKIAGEDLEGFLIQPMVKGNREMVAGLFTDDQFGPVVMFGLGGVFTEALDDVVFRLAPLDENGAGSMLDDIESRRLLGEFRGESVADRDGIIKTLTGLSRLAVDHPEIREIDINPLKISPDGSVCAVDALVVLGGPETDGEKRPALETARISAIFHPKSVAFVGASAEFRKWGHLMFTMVVAGGFEGEIHLVNPKKSAIAGRPVYKSVTDIPGPVDLAVVTVPSKAVLPLIPEFAEKGIKSVVLITSGFAEIGPEGRELEAELVRRARQADITILGPNTMGICNPYHKFYCTGAHVRPKAGGTAFISQSGNMGVQMLTFAEQQGIGIRAFAGSGNEAMMSIEDALDGFYVDKLTKTVLLYVESIKDGRRFFESARKVSIKKPVVLLKGGRTKAGSQAAASHTGALASNNRVFDAACRQAGIILADRSMDLLDLSAAFSSLPLPKGNRVGIMTLGGGWGVVTADLCAEMDIEVPELSPELIARFNEFLPAYWSRGNPIDLVGETDPTFPIRVMDELLAWDGCDAVINLGILGRRFNLQRIIESTSIADPDTDKQFMSEIQEMLDQYEIDYAKHLVGLMEKHKKPILGVSLASGEEEKTVYDVEGSDYKGIFFPTPERAVKALSEMCRYDRWLDWENVPVEERGAL